MTLRCLQTPFSCLTSWQNCGCSLGFFLPSPSFRFSFHRCQIYLTEDSSCLPVLPSTFPNKSFAYFSSVQSLSPVQLFATPWTAARHGSLSIINSWSLLRLMSLKLVMPSNHLFLYHPLLLPPSILPSIRVFSNESVLHIRWPKYWSFSFSISPSNEYSRTDFLQDGLVGSPCCPRTLKSLLQHHSTKASILRCSAFYIVQISHPYITTAKTIALTKATFVGKVMSLLFNMLSRLIIVFLPRSKCLLISWLQNHCRW